MAYTARKVNRNDYGTWAVMLERSQDNRTYWVDVWVVEKFKDVEADWNQFIFYLHDEEDCQRKLVQDSCDEFDEAVSEAICYLNSINELVQDEDGNWFCGITKEEWT